MRQAFYCIAFGMHRCAQAHVQRQLHKASALQALQHEAYTEEAALDWLCLNLESNELPKRLAGSSQPKTELAGVKVRATASEARSDRSGPLNVCMW